MNRIFKHKSSSRGFTLIELMITLSIAAILFSMAAPAYRDFTMNNLLASRMNHFNSVLQYARSQAIKDKLPITLCASADELATCNGTDWQSGWVLFSTDAGASTTTVLKVGSDFSDSNDSTLTATFGLNIVFDTEGTLTGGTGRGSFVMCDNRGASYAKAIILNSVGRTQKAYDSNEDGTVEDHDGNAVTCT